MKPSTNVMKAVISMRIVWKSGGGQRLDARLQGGAGFAKYGSVEAVGCDGGFFSLFEAGRWDFAGEILVDHAQRAADEIAIAISEIGVIARDKRVEAETSVLPERDFAQQKIPQHIGGEKIALSFRAIVN